MLEAARGSGVLGARARAHGHGGAVAAVRMGAIARKLGTGAMEPLGRGATVKSA